MVSKKQWLMRWGNFKAKELETYPFCLVDVLTIMDEYGDARYEQGRAETVKSFRAVYQEGRKLGRALKRGGK